MCLKKFFQLFASQKKSRENHLRPIGSHYNLKRIYDELNRQYFEGSLDLSIGWFGNANARSKTRIVFGAYHERLRLIKIHRRLDCKDIPLHFVSFVIYHEMLHHVLPPVSGRRRRRVHHSAFIEREKKFIDYALASEFREEFRRRFLVFLRQN